MLSLRNVALKKTEVSPSIVEPSQPDEILHPSCFRRLAESATGQALFLLDTDGLIRSWNAGAFDLFGYVKSEVIGNPLRFLMHPQSSDYEYDETLWRARQAGDDGCETSRTIRCHDGRSLSALVRVTAFKDLKHELTGYGVTARRDDLDDIERNYRDSQTVLNTIVEALHDPVFLKDLDGRYLLFNSAFAEHIGVGAEKIRGYTDLDLLSPEDHAIASQTDRIVLETETPHEYEYSHGQGAEQKITQVTKLPFYNAAGKAFGVFGLARDATLRRRQELQREVQLSDEYNARKDAERTVRRLEAIQAVYETVVTNLETPSLIAELLDRIMKVLRADGASVCLLSEDKKRLIHCQSRGDSENSVLEGGNEVGQGLIGSIISQNESLIVADRREHELGNLFENQQICGFIGSPLSLDGQVIGVLTLGSHIIGHFTDEDLQILRLVADRAAIAIERAQLFEELNAANAAMHRLSHRMLEVQEEERRHIARELHDEIGQMLTGIKLHVQNIPVSPTNQELAIHVQTSESYVDDAIREVRRLSTGLRPPALDVLGLESAIRECTERMATQAGIQHKVKAENIGRFDHDLEITLFRIAQEALTNVVRHARAKSVCISVQRHRKEVRLTVIDDGAGFDYEAAREKADHGRSYGLRGMEERSLLMDGRLSIKSRSGKGTVVEATFALREEGLEISPDKENQHE